MLRSEVSKQPKEVRMKLYVGDDLHANNNFLAIVDQEGKGVNQKKLPNDLLRHSGFLKALPEGHCGHCRRVDLQLVLAGGWVDGF